MASFNFVIFCDVVQAPYVRPHIPQKERQFTLLVTLNLSLLRQPQAVVHCDLAAVQLFEVELVPIP